MKKRTLESFRKTMKFIHEVYNGDPVLADMVVAELGQAVHPLPVTLFANRPKFNEQQWKDLIDGLEELGRMANGEGMKLCYHPHMGTGVMYEDEIDRLMTMTKPELVHLLLDTAHLDYAGVSPLSIAQHHGPRIKHIHLKNTRKDVVKRARAEDWPFQEAIEAGVFTVPGDPEGSIVFEPILEELANAKFEGWLVIEAEQDPRKAKPLHYASIARAFLKEHLEGAQ